MIEQFRRVWHGSDTDRSRRDFAPRAAGRVSEWSLERAARILRAGARSSLRIECNLDERAATPHELAVHAIAVNLARDHRERARAHAAWLVRRDYVDALLRALEPIATGPARLVA